MKIAFQFPAKFVFAKSKVEPRKVESEFPLYSFDNQNVYFCTKKEKVVHNKSLLSNCYFLLISNHLVYCGTRICDEEMLNQLDNFGETRLFQDVSKYADWIADPPKYEQEQAEIRERRRLEREEADREQQEQNERRAKAARESYLNSLDKYKKGEYISWDHFEQACKENGLNIPIKTMGWARKHLSEVAPNGYRGITKVKSYPLFNLMKELEKVLAK